MSGLNEFLMQDVELKVMPVVAAMEHNGYKVDPDHFSSLREKLEPERKELLIQIRKEAGETFDSNSHKQLQKLLYDRLKLKVSHRTEKGEPSTNHRALEQAARQHPVAGLILRLKKLSKILNTYANIPEMADDDGRLRVEFHQLNAATGRFSSGSIIQTLPRDAEFKIRNGFVAEEGHFIVGADYDQQELRVLAQVSGDPNLCDAISAGMDLHGLAAVKVFGLDCDPAEVKERYPEKRSQVKAVQFGILYGKTPPGLAETLGIERDEAERLIDDYFKQFPKIKHFIEDAHRRVFRDGYIDDLFGRRRSFPELVRKRGRQKEWRYMSTQEKTRARNERTAKREAQNFLIQGASVTITKLAMIRCHEHITAEHPDVKMILTLHDELQFEVPKKLVAHFAAELPGLMCDLGLEEMFGFTVPMDVEVKVGPSWGGLEKYEGIRDDKPTD